MSKLSAAFWLLLVLATGFATFKVKYAVQDIEDQLNKARRQTVAEQQEMRVLSAEWAYLNQPERLADLNRRFVGLVPIAAPQLQHSISELPMRASPSAVPDTLVAAVPSPAMTPHPVSAIPVAMSSGPAKPARPAVAVAAHAVPHPAVRFAKAVATGEPASLDALIAHLAEAR